MFWISKKIKRKIVNLEKEYNKLLINNEKLKVDLKVTEHQSQFIESLLTTYEILGIEINKNNIKQYICIQSSNKSISMYLRNMNQKTFPHPRCYAKIMQSTAGYHEGVCRIQDIFAVEEDSGNGTILLKYLIKYMRNIGIGEIRGMLSPVDIKEFDKLEHFYRKNGFSVTFNKDRTAGSITLFL